MLPAVRSVEVVELPVSAARDKHSVSFSEPVLIMSIFWGFREDAVFALRVLSGQQGDGQLTM